MFLHIKKRWSGRSRCVVVAIFAAMGSVTGVSACFGQAPPSGSPPRPSSLIGFAPTSDEIGDHVPRDRYGKILRFQNANLFTDALPAPSPGQDPGNQSDPGPQYTIPFANNTGGTDVKVQTRNGLISLVVRDAPLNDVLAVLARTQKLNIICANNINVRVTVTLHDVNLKNALNALLSMGGYTWTSLNGIIRVTSLADASSLPPEIQGRQIQVFELDYASAVDVNSAVTGFLSPIGTAFTSQSSSVDNRQTKEMIVVEDLPAYLHRIEQYVWQVDRPPRQVLIEVQILQVELKDDTRHGINFEALAGDFNIRTVGFANPNASPAFFIESTGNDVMALLEALKTTTDAKTLASPRVLIVSGQQARIQIGEQLGYRVTTTTETSSLESVDFLDVGVVLRVTPQISRDNRILMHVKPEVSSGQVNPETGLPEEETIEVESDVLLHDGHGMVIGGLIQEQDSILESKIPIIGDLKLVGALFQRRQVKKSRNEIIIALIPRVLPYELHSAARDASEVARAVTPLTIGPLRRVWRPEEPRLYDTYTNPIFPPPKHVVPFGSTVASPPPYHATAIPAIPHPKYPSGHLGVPAPVVSHPAVPIASAAGDSRIRTAYANRDSPVVKAPVLSSPQPVGQPRRGMSEFFD